jgi:flagellar hook assembly protein FlgD
VGVAVVDAAGRRVATLARGGFGPGIHALRWSGRDDAGRDVPSGAYWVRASEAASPGTGVRVVLIR